ncbi:MAG: hypothetical protein ABIG39_02360 [Candidatus Micrarchaeota archaeon]
MVQDRNMMRNRTDRSLKMPIIGSVSLNRNTNATKGNFVLDTQITLDGSTFPLMVIIDGNRRSVSFSPPKGQPYMFQDQSIDLVRIGETNIAGALKAKLESLDLIDANGLTLTPGENRRIKTKIVGILAAKTGPGAPTGFFREGI